MISHRIGIACTVVTLLLAGCASDPGTKVNSAESELSSDQQKAHNKEQDKNAEATRKQENEHAESAADKSAATTDGHKDVAVAKADLAQDRRDFDAKTKERLSKIDSRAKELKTKSAKLTGKKASDFKGHHANFTAQRAEATTKISSLESSTNEGWSTAKSDVEKKLDTLELSLDSMEKDL